MSDTRAVLAVPGVWIIPVPVPQAAGGPPTTNCVVLTDDGDGLATVVDPGFDTDEGFGALRAGLDAAGIEPARVRDIVVTHLHRDHRGLANRLRELTGATLAMHVLEQRELVRFERHGPAPVAGIADWGLPAEEALVIAQRAPVYASGSLPQVDRLVADGDLIGTGRRALRVLHTPGHTPGHICLIAAEVDMVLVGDLVLPDIYPGIGLGGPQADPLGSYRRSLDRVAALRMTAGIPGHGELMPEFRERITQTLAHHARRSEEVAAVLRAEPGATVWDVARRVTWSSGWEQVRGSALSAALAQIAMHVAAVRVG